MEFESACDRLCDNIAALLFEAGRPMSRTAFVAARATRDISDALHHASGAPDDPRWESAFVSLEQFLDACERSPRAARSAAATELRRFLLENRQQALAAAG